MFSHNHIFISSPLFFNKEFSNLKLSKYILRDTKFFFFFSLISIYLSYDLWFSSLVQFLLVKRYGVDLNLYLTIVVLVEFKLYLWFSSLVQFLLVKSRHCKTGQNFLTRPEKYLTQIQIFWPEAKTGWPMTNPIFCWSTRPNPDNSWPNLLKKIR